MCGPGGLLRGGEWLVVDGGILHGFGVCGVLVELLFDALVVAFAGRGVGRVRDAFVLG